MGELIEFLTLKEPQFRKARLGALYADFRHLRTTNPDGYTANIEAWQRGLAVAAIAGHIPNRGAACDTLILNIDDEVMRELETKEWGRPLALGTVLRESIAKKDLLPLQDFKNATDSIYRRSWMPSPLAVLSWSLRQVGLLGGESTNDKLPTSKLVIIRNLESASKALSERVSQYSSKTDRILSRRLFNDTCSDLFGHNTTLSSVDTEVLLKFLARDKGLLAFDVDTVKFKGPSETAVEITREDSTIASLKTLMRDMEAQIDALTQRVNHLRTSAYDAIAQKNMASAKASLRSKKLAESNLTRQAATLGQLEEVYTKIEQAADQIELLRILEGSTGVLKQLNGKVGGIERVDNIVDELKEQMTQVDEINNTIGEVGQIITTDSGDIDDELEAMEIEERQKVEKVARAEKEARGRMEVEETRKKLAVLDASETEAAMQTLEGHDQSVQENYNNKTGIGEEVLQGLKRISLEAQTS